MTDWLRRVAIWDTFSTWTFGRIVTLAGARHWAERHLGDLSRMAEQPVYAFWVTEQGRSGGLLHLHALVGNVAHLKHWCGIRLPLDQQGAGCCMLHRWPCGVARVLKYDPELGAGFYISKYLTKQVADWDFYGDGISHQEVGKWIQ